MQDADEINLVHLNESQPASTPDAHIVSGMYTGWTSRTKIFAGIIAVIGMAVFTVTLFVPILVTQSKYTTATTLSTIINTTTVSTNSSTNGTTIIVTGSTASTNSTITTSTVNNKTTTTMTTSTTNSTTTTTSTTSTQTTPTSKTTTSAITTTATTSTSTSSTSTTSTSTSSTSTTSTSTTSTSTTRTSTTSTSTSSTSSTSTTSTSTTSTSTTSTSTTTTSTTSTSTSSTSTSSTSTTSTSTTSTSTTSTSTTSTSTTTISTTSTSTSSTSTTVTTMVPYLLDVQPGTATALWATYAGGISTLAQSGTGVGTYPSTQLVTYLFDKNLNTVYSNEGNSSSGTNTLAGLNTGFYVTIAECQPTLTGFRFGHYYNNSASEPLMITVEGTSCNNLTTCMSWTLIYNGSSGLDVSGNSSDYGSFVSLSNSMIYQSYRFLVTAKRNISDYVSYNEVELYGYATQTSSGSGGSLNSTSLFIIQYQSVESLWNINIGGTATIATESSTGIGTYLTSQSSKNLFDGNTNTSYASRGYTNTGSSPYAGMYTGFHLTIARCQPTLVKFRFATDTSSSISNDDPTTVIVEGTSCGDLIDCTNWTTLYSGQTGLLNVTSRSTFGGFQYISSPQIFPSYRFTVTAKKGSSAYVSYSEVELYGY